MPQSDMEQWSSALRTPDGSAPRRADRRGGTWPSVGGGDEGAPLSSTVSSHYQLNEAAGAVGFNHVSSFNASLVAIETVDSQLQQTQPSLSLMDNLLSQGSIYDAPSSQKQESGSAHPQQPRLPYVCTFCSRRYSHRCQLRVHTREKPYQCTQCGKSFGQFCSLKRHQMVHTGERPFPCPQCGKQFSTSTNMKVHQSVHTGEKRFHCSKCGKNFSFLNNLIWHQALHTAK